MKVAIAIAVLILWGLVEHTDGWWSIGFYCVMGGLLAAIPLYCLLAALGDIFFGCSGHGTRSKGPRP